MSGKERRRRTSLELLFDIDGAGGRAKKSRFGTPSKKGGDDDDDDKDDDAAASCPPLWDDHQFSDADEDDGGGKAKKSRFGTPSKKGGDDADDDDVVPPGLISRADDDSTVDLDDVPYILPER